MPAKFPNADLVACARREAAMRKAVYPRKESRETIVDCSEKLQKEHAMMEAIAEQLEALPELLRRYDELKIKVAVLEATGY